MLVKPCNMIALFFQKRTLRNGTTTACYFATIHTDASLLLCQITGKISPPSHVSAKALISPAPRHQLKSIRVKLSKTNPLAPPSSCYGLFNGSYSRNSLQSDIQSCHTVLSLLAS